MPARPSAGLVNVQPRVALLRIDFRPDGPPGSGEESQSFQARIPGSVGQVAVGIATVQITTPDSPQFPSGLPAVGFPGPAGCEDVSSGPSASLGHRYLPPCLLGHCIGVLLHCPPMPICRLGQVEMTPTLSYLAPKRSPLHLPYGPRSSRRRYTIPPPHWYVL